MGQEKAAASILERLRRAQELVEEVEILATRDENALQHCASDTALEISKVTSAIGRLTFIISCGLAGRSDGAFYEGGLRARGRHENFFRQRTMWRRRARSLEASARDALEAGRDGAAVWYREVAAELRAKLAATKEP